ncbi:Lsr2 family DNA-binding protein [Actinomadura rubrisoli]|uniref:Lsr2 DNA-binding domain-containing protein n=1 Tax=Actinomadura rubrisoli TaxID=2530368 RepID=A0A4R5AYK4_9ACTN|nr:histone-like nucleoid-structuring protein Lsr2 [Actinomadura rubrisoli]TDD77715.1 hypothetical protein E1298_29750 [Actinomadura rubrisoli]
MTLTSPAPTDAGRIRELLVTGKKVQQVADLTGWPRQSVIAVITATKGWLLDQEKDTVYQPGNAGMTPQLPGTAPTPPERDQAPRADVPLGDAPVAELLAGAADIDDKAVQRELGKATDAIARLRQVVASAQERIAAVREIAVLERQLAEAKARAKNAGVRRASPAAGTAPRVRASNAEIRAWAAENGIEVASTGKIARSVIEQYDAAHGAGA